MTDKELAQEEVLSKIDKLEVLYNNDYVTFDEYWKIKNRILDRLVEVSKYYDNKCE